MPETLEDIERKILDVEADIQEIKKAQRENGGLISPDDKSLLVSYNAQLAALREKEKRLAVAAAAAAAAVPDSATIAEAVREGFAEAVRALAYVHSPLIDSETQTPPEGVGLVSSSSAKGNILPLPPQFPAPTRYLDYQTKSDATLYFNKLKEKFNSANDTCRYALKQSRHHCLVYDGQKIIFRVIFDNCSLRNLLLEFHGSNYHVETWLEMRSRGEFDNCDYQSFSTP